MYQVVLTKPEIVQIRTGIDLIIQRLERRVTAAQKADVDVKLLHRQIKSCKKLREKLDSSKLWEWHGTWG